MRFTHLLTAGVLGSLAAQGACLADDADTARTVVNGFGTLGYVYNDRRDAGFVRDLTQLGVRDRSYSWRPDSRLGIQFSHSTDSRLQFVGQLVLRDQPSQSPNRMLSRAFVSWRATPDMQVRAGRLADTMFLMSDYYEVGYAYPWVRPPVESYGVISLNHYDGADFTYSLRQDDATWRIKGLAGRIKSEMPSSRDTSYFIDTDYLWGLTLVHERGPLKLRAGYTTLKLRRQNPLSAQIRPALGAFASAPMNPYADEARRLYDDIDLTGTRVGLTSVGGVYDDGTWMVQSELSLLEGSRRAYAGGKQGYLSVGRHFGNLLPYFIASAALANPLTRAESDWGPAYAPLQQGALAVLNAQRVSQRTLSVGVRWDFDSNAALKLQWDNTRVFGDGWYLWKTDYPFSPTNKEANIVSATLDFMF